MKIKHGVLRTVAAATITLLMAAGAVPAYATDADDSTTETSQQQESEESSAAEDSASDESAEDEGTSTKNGTTCNKLGYTKIDRGSGSEDLEFGSLEWGGDTLAYVVDEGYTVELCIKSGAKAPITEFTVDGADEGSQQIAQDISHIGYIVADAPAEEAEEAPAEEAPEDEAPEETPEDEAPAEEAPAEGTSCPEGSVMGADGECVVAPAEDGACPEGSVMNDEGECVVPPVEVAPTEETADAEVLGVEAARGMPETGAAADVAPEEAASTGLLPDTGAARYGLPILVGLGLLTAGGVLLARRRQQAGS